LTSSNTHGRKSSQNTGDPTHGSSNTGGRTSLHSYNYVSAEPKDGGSHIFKKHLREEEEELIESGNSYAAGYGEVDDSVENDIGETLKLSQLESKPPL
jgi:hypothetical protein